MKLYNLRWTWICRELMTLNRIKLIELNQLSLNIKRQNDVSLSESLMHWICKNIHIALVVWCAFIQFSAHQKNLSIFMNCADYYYDLMIFCIPFQFQRAAHLPAICFYVTYNCLFICLFIACWCFFFSLIEIDAFNSIKCSVVDNVQRHQPMHFQFLFTFLLWIKNIPHHHKWLLYSCNRFSLPLRRGGCFQ